MPWLLLCTFEPTYHSWTSAPAGTLQNICSQQLSYQQRFPLQEADNSEKKLRRILESFCAGSHSFDLVFVCFVQLPLTKIRGQILHRLRDPEMHSGQNTYCRFANPPWRYGQVASVQLGIMLRGLGLFLVISSFAYTFSARTQLFQGKAEFCFREIFLASLQRGGIEELCLKDLL